MKFGLKLGLNHISAHRARASAQISAAQIVKSPGAHRAGGGKTRIDQIPPHTSVVRDVCDGIIAPGARETALHRTRNTASGNVLTHRTRFLASLYLAYIIQPPCTRVDLAGIAVGALGADSREAPTARRLVLPHTAIAVGAVRDIARGGWTGIGYKVLV